MFLLLTSAPDPRQDPRAERLAALLRKHGRTFLLSISPRCDDPEGEADDLSATLRRLVEKNPPRIMFALDAATARVIVTHAFLKPLPWVLCPASKGPDAPAWSGDSIDEAFRAREIWREADGKALPRELRGRTAVLPSGRTLPDWVDRRLQKLSAAQPRAASSHPLSSLIIPVYNGRKLLKSCVDSLRRHTTPPHEIIVVNNASDAATTRYMRSLKGVRLIENRTNRGFAHAVNQGMRAARGRYIGWINSDTVCSPEWLERMIDCLMSDPAIAAAGPMTNRTVGAQMVRLKGDGGGDPRTLDRYARAWSLMHSGQHQDAHRLTGFFTLFKRRAVEAVGLLDERFGAGCYEDYDYCLRLRQAGFQLALAPDVFIYHREHVSFGSDENFNRQCDANRAIFVRKWCESSLAFLDQIDSELAYEPRARAGSER
ncbi:MAG: hypothetical protein A2506_07075 [Elusimicrobia bacterium RIFOXYD12_FULL_66_9]|nr:MAG: hypothetical protein A2506_07075 [Elusimicrobia bacterium RIFOXYD12_FULL_66_9]